MGVSAETLVADVTAPFSLVAALIVASILTARPEPASAAALAPVSPVMACSDLMSLPFTSTTAGTGRLLSATLVTPSGSLPYCDVVGYVPAEVKFEVRLPVSGWTQRLLFSGCGGYCGMLNPANGANGATGCLPLQSGEMVLAATDMGHSASPTTFFGFADGLFAERSPEAVIDFAYASLHKSVVAVKALIKTFYGRAQTFSYFSGCSDGGREALHLVERHPKDFDGVAAGAPVIDEVATNTFYHAWNVRVNADSNGHPILTSDKIPALHSAVLAACGKLNGGVGDMLQDFRACNFNANSIACPQGVNTTSCLTPDQARVANLLWQGPVDPSGAHLSAGDMPIGSELAWPGTMVLPTGSTISPTTTVDGAFSYDFPNYMATFGAPTGITAANIKFERSEFDFLHQLSGIYDPTNPDISAFADNGGKLLLWQGWADSGASPYMTLNYYDAVRSTLGKQTADSFMTLYMIPGVYHCNGGPSASSEDFLTSLMQWVEDGTRPGRVVVSYATSAVNPVAKTRPVYPYPNIAVWTGSGDVNNAANYVEAPPKVTFGDHYEWLGSSHYQASHQQTCLLQGEAGKAAWVCQAVEFRND
jgi:hypothetical protein